MKSFRDRSPYVIGVVSVAVIAALVALAFLVGLRHVGERAYKVDAEFADAAGLRIADDVRVAGVKAGRVSGIRADRQKGRVIVTLVVRDGVHLGPMTSAEIALQTLLGRKYVRLTGDVHRPYLQDGPARAVIPLDRTRTPFDVFELARVGTRVVQSTDTERFNQLITQLATVTEDKHDQLTDLLSGIGKVSTAITERDQQLRDLLDHAATLSDTLADKDQTLVGLIDRSQAVLDLLNRRRDDVARGLDRGAVAVGELAGVLDRNMARLDSILDSLHPTLDVVDRHRADLARALSWLGPGAYSLALAPSHGPWADIYVRNIGPDLIGLLQQVKGS